MMNGKHRAPRKYTHIEKIRIMNDAVVFMFGCMTLVCEIRVGSFLFFEMNVILLLLGTAEICLACFMYYQEFMAQPNELQTSSHALSAPQRGILDGYESHF